MAMAIRAIHPDDTRKTIPRTMANPPQKTRLKIHQLLCQLPKSFRSRKSIRINGVDYTDKNEAAEAASKAIFG